ncbi:MAG: methylmalonyl Co-A mutase-associated GTPase MeaB [Desulfuromonas sp.]|uniref:methylmalonyl Co-A mutase-associated GTPase MeaB n=1 Tax=Desulfuromonas sp. TaxID=892 RepID=UPI000CB0E2D3|nr:methylmalonyl Co-A mutase-associated GTPase MeaB [Desulfuromonas sp.]PLX83356.1 MAG: methylmalonyl Co-A mutase-associated GTPase MeaB [Desulfuromonas sp.]
MTLAEKILRGEVRAAARLMRDIDDGMPTAVEELKALFPHTGRAYIIGVTGPPGAGKSTLTDKLIEAYRRKGKTVAVVAIDPTSPFSGGAILGDRIRMNRHATDEGVFIRSLGTRGHLGGLSRSTNDIVSVFDAMGWDVVIVETVGVGQDEVEIVRTAHTSLVVMVPGLGDDIQAIKAGILEIGDVFVVNKADRPDVERAVRDLEVMIEMNHPPEGEWWPPVVKTVAQKQEGIEELVAKIEAHREHLGSGEALARFEENKSALRFEELLKEQLFRQVHRRISHGDRLTRIVEAIARRELDPYTAVEAILKDGD